MTVKKGAGQLPCSCEVTGKDTRYTHSPVVIREAHSQTLGREKSPSRSSPSGPSPWQLVTLGHQCQELGCVQQGPGDPYCGSCSFQAAVSNSPKSWPGGILGSGQRQGWGRGKHLMPCLQAALPSPILVSPKETETLLSPKHCQAGSYSMKLSGTM